MTSSVSYTAKLLNYIEPYYIDGVAKSAFYSEVNTNIKRNDKVFILNGFNDSEVFISKGKYAKNADGYKVLYVDRCKIVLDIDHKGQTQSYIDSDFDQYIKIYHIRNQREFDYINKLYIDTYTSSRISKFEKGYTNNIIYSDSIFTGYTGDIGENGGLSSTNSFWAKSGNTWVSMTSQFNNNSFTFSTDYYARGLTNNGRIYIMGEDISYGRLYKERNAYKFSDVNSINSWKIDIDYKQPIITKLNFREGTFRGIHNDGIFGTYLKEENWYGTQSKWNSGFFVNSKWNSGIMRSKSTNSDASYYAIMDKGIPVQTTDFSNNKGYGYNYVVDSNIYAGQIENGNFINCNIGLPNSGLTAVDSYVNNVSNTFPLRTLGGLYNYCDIYGSEISNSTTLDSIINNSYLNNTRTLNSQLSESYSNGGEFSNDNSISVLSAEIMSYIPNNIGNTTTSSLNIRGVIKLYISDTEYERIDTFDNFFITKINKDYILSTLNSDQKILLPYETRYVLDTFLDFKISGVNQQCLCSLKTKFDNLSKIEVVYTSPNYTNNITDNMNKYASIDIDLGQYIAFYLDQVSSSYIYLNDNIIKKENAQNLFLNTKITNSDFRNGVIKNIKWKSGSSVNYPSNIIKIESGKLKISKSGSSDIDVYLNEYRPTINDDQLKIGTYVWIDSIHHTDLNGINTSISGCYLIKGITFSQIQNETRITISNSIINSIPGSGTYSVLNNLPTYASINKLIIDSSEISSGLFTRTLFKNSTFENEGFDNLDRNLSENNIEKLRINNVILKDNNNTIKSGLIYKSHILGVNWISGIANNSIWIGPTFGGGVFNNGYWERGTFDNGYFQNSRDITLSNPDYSYYQHYKNWLNGTFNNGVFYNSIWLNGTFNNGKLYNSDWYGGIWNNGILGDKNIPTLNTNMGKSSYIGIGATHTVWYDGIVENSQIGGDGIVYWYGGKFNNGVFTSNGTSPLNESIWYNGEFNGGDFSNLSRWKNGSFNKGKFTSYYGWTMSSSTYSFEYGWENGQFNGGQFGIGNFATNSVWYNGEFNGGIFQGRVWNDGIFQNGNFNGGSTYSVIDNESQFTESFIQSYYGLWRNGWVTNIKHKAITSELISNTNLRSGQIESQKNASLKNILWLNGIFEHSSGTIENSAWLDGKFRKGIFKNSVFNPYVRRDNWSTSYGTYSSFNFSIFNCVWENGVFDNGTFYISDWYDGKFLNGTMSGSRWINGIWEYGFAKNIYWSGGTWKNGTWDGSPFDYKNLSNSNDMVYGKDSDIILRVSNILRDGKVHLINAFTGSYTSEILLDTLPTSFAGWTFSDTGTQSSNWVSSYNGLELSSSFLSNPSLTIISQNYYYPSYDTNEITFEVGADVYPGDTYTITMYNAWITITAVVGDTPISIAQKISTKINDGQYQSVVQYNQYTPYPPYYITQYANWTSIDSSNAYNYPYSTYSSNQFTVTYKNSTFAYGYVSSGGYIGGVYNESEVLYALTIGPTTSIFTQSSNHNITLDVSNSNGRTDFAVFIGENTYRETITGNISKSYTYNYAPTVGNTTYQLGIKRVLYQNPDNSSFKLNGASIKTIDASYVDYYNNKLFQFGTFSSPFSYGPTGSTISLPSQLVPYLISNEGPVSLKFGNGVFKSGVWESGYWNNGWRSTWNENEKDIILFTDITIGGVLEISSNLWTIKLQAFNKTADLNIGDKVSIGNIVCIDVNENRRLIKNYFRIINKDDNTITVEISLNMPVRRIIKDSENHMMYVSKNVWISGVFHNGYFKGIWNYGLFKGYPYITKMEDSHWIDGVFDGGRFSGTTSYYLERGETASYNTGLIQNFIFRDNNIAGPDEFSYNSWIDVTYVTYSMTNIFKDNMRYNSKYGVIISDGNLKGYPTFDVLSSDSIFKNSYDSNYKHYKLGSKYKTYIDYMGDDSYFTYPISSIGDPGVSTFISKGWTYTSNSTLYYSNTGNGDDGELVVKYNKVSFTNIGIKSVQTKSLTFVSPNFHVTNGGRSDVGSIKGDFSNIPAGSGTDTADCEFTIKEIGATAVQITDKRFSRLSYTASNWHFNTIPSLSANAETYGLNFGIQITGDTDASIRRAYMFDWFDLNSTDEQYNGYDRSMTDGITASGYEFFTQTGLGGNTFSFGAYKVPHDSSLVINAFVPFSFYADETSRDGWSMFKLTGVVEKCGSASNPSLDSSWQYVTNTSMGVYQGYGYAVDVNYCGVFFDEDHTLVGNLYINGVTINVIKGDYIRFRLYWVDVRKMFASSDPGESPGFMRLNIGVDPSMGYGENNHGFFEVYDPSTYVSLSTNLLDNIHSRNIERFRYSVVDFNLDRLTGAKYQSSTGRESDLPSVYLLNDFSNTKTPGTFSVVVNHAETNQVNKREFFYNRKSLEMFFRATDDFIAKFSKIGFYETDMIPFFRYTLEENVDKSIKYPIYEVAPFISSSDSSISLNGFLIGTQSSI